MSPGVTQFNSHHPVFDSVPCNWFSSLVLPRLFIYVLSYSHKGLFNSHHPVFDSVPCNRFSSLVLPRLFIYVLSYSRAWSEM